LIGSLVSFSRLDLQQITVKSASIQYLDNRKAERGHVHQIQSEFILISVSPKSVRKNAGRREEDRQTIDKGRQPALGLLSKAAEGDRPPFFALTRGSGVSPEWR
jgi:hypothetical protein